LHSSEALCYKSSHALRIEILLCRLRRLHQRLEMRLRRRSRAPVDRWRWRTRARRRRRAHLQRSAWCARGAAM